MPDRLTLLARRLLPDRALAWFEPARQDLEVERLREEVGVFSRARLAAIRIRHRLRIVILTADSLRLALVDRPGVRPPSIVAPRRAREPFNMIAHDIRHSLRRLVREPGFTAAAVLTLALGVGGNVAVFAVVEAVLLRPLPYSAPDELAVIRHRDQRTGITKQFIAIGDFVDLVNRQTSFTAIGSYGFGQATVYGEGDPFQVSALHANAATLEVLGVRPAFGRGFKPEDSRRGAGRVMLVGHDLWERRFGGDSSLVGRSLTIDDQSWLVVGIAPRGFRFPPNATIDAILAPILPEEAPAGRKSEWSLAVARLKPGRSITTATAELAGIARQMEQEHPEENQASTYYAVSLRDEVVGNTKPALILLLAAVGVVLLIACVNVANLLLARSLGRRREMAVRMALGAGRARIAGQLLIESAVLAVVALVVGVIFAHFGARALVALVPRSVNVAGLAEVKLNGAVLAFAFFVAAATAVGFGLVAALATKLESAAHTLVTAGRGTVGVGARRTSAILVGAEMAFAVVLLIGAGLILKSFAALLAVDPGFQVERVETAEIMLPPERYASVEARGAFYRRAFAAIRAIPGVTDIGAAVVVPLTGNNWSVPFERSDQPVPPGQRPPDVGWQVASGSYFKALAIPLKAGRLFDDRDRPGTTPVVIVSEAIRRRFFGTENPVGMTIKLSSNRYEIVGVVGDIRRAGLSDEPWADLYFPFEQSPSVGITLFTRAAGSPDGALPAIREALRTIEPNVAVLSARSLADVASESVQVTQLVLWLLGAFAVAALALAAIGIYGVMSYLVRQRTREIGTRLALGASRPRILLMVLGEGARIALIGTAIGLGVGLVAAKLLDSILFGVTTTDPMVLVAATLTLLVTAMIGCYLPARRAASVDPVETLSVQ